MDETVRGRGRPPMSERRRSIQRLAISREAVRLFREQGVAATSGEQIADAVALSVRTLWRYFRTKEHCVEPLLSLAVDGFLDVLRQWPADLTLDEHLACHEPGQLEPGDRALVIGVFSLARTEPAIRAIWLVLFERAEPVLAELLAGRLGRSADELEVRVQAATLAAALRISCEDWAGAMTAGVERDEAESLRRLARAIEIATDGIIADRAGQPA